MFELVRHLVKKIVKNYSRLLEISCGISRKSVIWRTINNCNWFTILFSNDDNNIVPTPVRDQSSFWTGVGSFAPRRSKYMCILYRDNHIVRCMWKHNNNNVYIHTHILLKKRFNTPRRQKRDYYILIVQSTYVGEREVKT